MSRSHLAAHRRRERSWLAPHLWSLAGVFLLSVAGVAVDILWPALAAYLIDHVILSPQLDLQEKRRELVLAAVAGGVLFSTEAGLRWLRDVRAHLQQAKLALHLQRRLLRHVLRLPFGELDRMQTGGVVSRLSEDVPEVAGLAQSALMDPAVACLRLLAMFGMLLVLDYRVALAVAGTLPVALFWHVRRLRTLVPIWDSALADREQTSGRLAASLGGLPVVRGFSRERREEQAYVVGGHTVMRKHVLGTHVERSLAGVWDLIAPLNQVGILCFGGYLVTCGQMTMGVLAAMQSYAPLVLEPLRQLAGCMVQTQGGLAALARTHELLDKGLDMPDSAGAVDAPVPVELLELQAVSFGYDPGRLVIKDVTFTAPAGSVTALIGRSGAGKTTLIHLIARLHDPASGRVCLNGVDLRSIKLKSYRRLVAMVPQRAFLFTGSVRDNIAYGCPGAALEEIQQAAERANAHQFITELPRGYDSVIGERGVNLSGGQRQRIALARAFLADPAILILDEATSNLDAESEHLIQAAMPELLAGRTTFIIAHRLSTVTSADQIIVLDRGRVLEQGSHIQLMERRGAYFDAVQRQHPGPLPSKGHPAPAKLQDLSLR